MKKQLLFSIIQSFLIIITFVICNPADVYASEQSLVETPETDIIQTENQEQELQKISNKEKTDKNKGTDNETQSINSIIASNIDMKKPNVSAAVSNGYLSVNAIDESGIQSIYVNGNEFTNIEDGKLKIRLQQYDASKQRFEIKAEDKKGNVSDTYTASNPYFVSNNTESNEKTKLLSQLPISAEPTQISSATAIVTEHIKTSSNGNQIIPKQNFSSEDNNKTSGDAFGSQTNVEDAEKGKEFYTIQADTGKVFYLVIDRDGEEEKVYFLTEINENDLLHVTENNSEVLPQDSTVVESSIPTKEVYIDEAQEAEEETATETEKTEELPSDTNKPNQTNLIIIIAAVIAFVALYYFKVMKKKDQGFIEEDEEDDEDYDDDEDADENDDFFSGE